MGNIKPDSIEAMFTSKEEIDDWYEAAADGYAKIMASMVDKHGLDGFDAVGKILMPAIHGLTIAKERAYETVLDRKPDAAEVLSFQDIFRRYIKK